MEAQTAMRELREAVASHRRLHGHAVMDSRSLFAAIDRDMDGSLSREEFREALARLDLTQYGWRVSDAELDRLVDAMDSNRSGVIEWDEFLAATGLVDSGHSEAERLVRSEQERLRKEEAALAATRAPMQDMEHPDRATQALLFKRMDINGNGVLSLAEIDKAVHEFWPGMDHKPALIRAYKAADINHDGFIGRREFGKLLSALCYFNNLFLKFDSIDADGDRRLDEHEFVAGIAHVGVKIGASQARNEFFQLAERNGHVLFHEFCKFCFEHHVAEEGIDEPEPEPEPEPERELEPEPEPEPDASTDRVVGRRTTAGVWVGEGAPAALHDELQEMASRKAMLQKDIQELEDAKAQQVAAMVKQRNDLKSSMDAMDLQKSAAEKAANDAKKQAAAHKATYLLASSHTEAELRPETLPVPNDPVEPPRPENTAWVPHQTDPPFHVGAGASIASRQSATALAEDSQAVHDWREEREDTLLSLARRPLDLWRPTNPPPPESLAELDAAVGMQSAEPLSLRWLSEHALDEWNETAFPTHPTPSGNRARTEAAQETPIQTGPSDALLVFRAAFTDWMSEQTDKRGTVPGTTIKLITPDELHMLAQTARGYLGMEAVEAPASGQRNITAVELCEHLRPARREGEDPTTSAQDLAGDAKALKEYLTGGTGAGEADLHRLMGLAPPPGAGEAKQAVSAASASRAAALKASQAARVAMAESEEAERKLREATQAALDTEHQLARQDPKFGSADLSGSSRLRTNISEEAALSSATTGMVDSLTAAATGSEGAATDATVVPGRRDEMSVPSVVKAFDEGASNLENLLGPEEDQQPEPEEIQEPEIEETEELGLDYAWFKSAHPDLMLANPNLFRDEDGEVQCGCTECNSYGAEGAGKDWDPQSGHGSVVTHKKGGGWRAALAKSRVMRGGLHYATFKLHRGGHVVVGVAPPDFDATNGDLPSGAGGKGWGFYAVGGQMVHDGQWGDWEGMQPAPPDAEVGLLLDYERATLTVFINGIRCGILADGVSGPLCWMTELRNVGDSVELREQPAPENEACIDCASRGIARRACFGERGTTDCSLCGLCAVAFGKDGPLHGGVELCTHMRDGSQRFTSKSSGVTTGGTDRSGVSTEPTQVRSNETGKAGDGSACAGEAMRHGVNYIEFTVLDPNPPAQIQVGNQGDEAENERAWVPVTPSASGEDSAKGVKIGVTMAATPQRRAFDSPKAWGLEVSTGNRVHAGKLSKWNGMRPAYAGDLLGLLLDFQTGTMTLFINGERCGIVWDGLGNKLHFCVELNGLETTPPPPVRLLPPPRAPREQPAPLRAEEPPPVEPKPRVKSTATGSEAVGMQTESRTSPMIYDPNPNATTANYPLAQVTGGRATANPSRMAQVAQIFRRFDGDRDRYLNFTEVAALEWEVSRQELSPANYVALCEAVDADQQKGLDEQCLHRFYEMAGVGELHNAYEKLFKAPSNWQSPLAEWAVRDARAVGGLPRIYLSSQPESAFVPDPKKEDLHLNDEDLEEHEPKAREVWTQTGFGTPMPRPIVRYGAPKRPANSGRHASIPSRYGKYKPGGGPKSSDGNGKQVNSTETVAHGPAWVPGKKNPRKLRAPEMPRAVAPRRAIPRREDLDAREYWRREASKRERLPITNRRGHNSEALGSASAEVGLLKVGGGGSSGEVAAALSSLHGAHSKQAARLDAMQAQLQAAKMAARLQAANAQNTALLEQLNSVSFVGSDLRSALTAAPATSADWNQRPPHKSGQAAERLHSPAVIPQPLYAGYPNVAEHTNFRRALPLDALLARSGSAARNVGRGEEGEVAGALQRSVDAASMITFGTSGAVKQMY
eukprot:COSAG02_NODE_2278_length_9240_cov_2.311016_2_plen_1828_part_00